MSPIVKFVKLVPQAVIPEYKTVNAAGMDLVAAESCILGPGDIQLVGTGLGVEIPPGYEGQVRPRSGLALNDGITVLNAPGTIDADYRGEIGVILVNHSTEQFKVSQGMRIAQLVIAEVPRCIVEEVAGLSDTARGTGAFGSTGK